MWTRSPLGSLRRGRLDLIRVFQAPHTKAQSWIATLLTVTRKKLFTTLIYFSMFNGATVLKTSILLFAQGHELLFFACVDKRRKPEISGDKCDGHR